MTCSRQSYITYSKLRVLFRSSAQFSELMWPVKIHGINKLTAPQTHCEKQCRLQVYKLIVSVHMTRIHILIPGLKRVSISKDKLLYVLCVDACVTASWGNGVLGLI